ncbi:hypothetical protein BV25DRAFT_1912319 [Artomyces pyxidatus]|uniref:Uncharacterized protein n=1 Tax=Artomyces pyxidatus TaxID=48021 RepID=A0ACB8TEU6_9AGAM|nr:hypothetical protein BV25DRAFT_1912319 [Artomyces pyxidatus]
MLFMPGFGPHSRLTSVSGSGINWVVLFEIYTIKPTRIHRPTAIRLPTTMKFIAILLSLVVALTVYAEPVAQTDPPTVSPANCPECAKGFKRTD